MTDANPTLVFRRRRLPHWLVAEHAYFATLCRKGCLPARVTAELRAEREAVARDVSDRASRGGRSDTSRPTLVLPAAFFQDTDREKRIIGILLGKDPP
jgi:hypothetical protein